MRSGGVHEHGIRKSLDFRVDAGSALSNRLRDCGWARRFSGPAPRNRSSIGRKHEVEAYLRTSDEEKCGKQAARGQVGRNTANADLICAVLVAGLQMWKYPNSINPKSRLGRPRSLRHDRVPAQEHLDYHPEIVGPVAASVPFVGGVEGAKVQAVHRVGYLVGQIAPRQPVAQVRRHHHGLVGMIRADGGGRGTVLAQDYKCEAAFPLWPKRPETRPAASREISAAQVPRTAFRRVAPPPGESNRLRFPRRFPRPRGCGNSARCRPWRKPGAMA